MFLWSIFAEFMTELRMIDHLFDRMKELSHVAAILLALPSTTTTDDNKANADIMILVLVSNIIRV